MVVHRQNMDSSHLKLKTLLDNGGVMWYILVQEHERSPSEIGGAYRVKREVLFQIDWDNPQFS